VKYVLLLLLTSCGLKAIKGSPELAVYNERIKAEALERGIFMRPTPAIFVDTLPGRAIGQCHSSPRRIEVKKSYWLNASDKMRYSLMLHEQGHCAFDFRHKEDTIMDPNIQYPTEELIEDFWQRVEDN
jgi:hypothetical protein